MNTLTLHPYAIEIGNSKEKGAVFANMPITDNDVQEICKNTRLVNLTLSNTKITDKALEYLTVLPNLAFLTLNNNNITGEGFVHFAEHKKLSSIDIKNTKVHDETLKIIANIPNVRTLHIDDTDITFAGILAVANNKKLKFISKTQFTTEQIETFEQTQRNLAKKKTAITISEEDINHAKNHLLAFFKAMTEWEKFAYSCKDRAEQSQKVKALYQKFATEKWHDEDRLSYSGMSGGTYGKHQIVDYEIISKNRFYIFTNKEIADVTFHYRFLMIKQKDHSWRIDGCQVKYGHWEKQYL